MQHKRLTISEAVLDGRGHWEKWLQYIKWRAISGCNVWHLINPDLPTQPQHLKPQPPPFSNVRAGARSFQELDADQRECWKMEYQLMKDNELRQYYEEESKLEEINVLILDSVYIVYSVYLHDNATVWELLRLLKEKCGPGVDQRDNIEKTG
jgi:hypothetical protein